MTMTVEEKFNKDVWFVLQEIHKKSLYVKKGAAISYEIDPSLLAIKYIDSDDEEKILYKLQEWKAISITDDGSAYANDYVGGPHYKIIELKKNSGFNECYDKYKNIFNPDIQISKADLVKKTKTYTDYVIEAINYFKDEYNKVRISGLEYEYELGENFARANDDMTDEQADEHTFRLRAINQLKNVGFITKYTTEERVLNDGYYVWDYAICKIDESKLTQKEAPIATDAAVKALTKKVIHEHTHRFENSIQEKGIDLKHIFEKDNKSSFYITKKDDDFYYKGLHILASKKRTDYYKVFCALYAKLPEGGEISYKNLIAEIKSRMPEQKNKTDDEMQKFIQRNLTDRSNGFMRYAEIPETEDNGKALIEIVRSSGVLFNNKVG